MFDWLRRLFGGTPPAPPPARDSAPRPPEPPLPALPLTPEEVFTALGRPVPERRTPSEEELAEAEALAAKIRRNFEENPVGPASFPSSSLRLLNLIAQPDVELASIVQICGQDPALAASVLRVANSGAFGGVSEIETVRAAVARLGIEEVGRVAGAIAARTLFSMESRAEFAAFAGFYDELFKDAASVAMGAAGLALQRKGARSDRAYLIGLLRDVGKSVALRAIRPRPGEPKPSEALVAQALELVHLELGGEVQQAWSLPACLVAACVRHHDTRLPDDAETTELHLVRVVSGVRQVLVGKADARDEMPDLLLSAHALRMDARQLRTIAADLASQEQRVRAFFK